jgi:hypothetical protein
MSFGDWIRRLIGGPDPDHPLTDEERERLEHTPQNTFDSRAQFEQEYVGNDLDPDEPRSGRL